MSLVYFSMAFLFKYTALVVAFLSATKLAESIDFMQCDPANPEAMMEYADFGTWITHLNDVTYIIF